jgi:EAL and modified HD-GYP domain-containing signal transduction protein
MNEKQEAAVEAPAFLSIARQPVFDTKRQLWGYELFGVGGTGSFGADSTALNVAASAYIALQQILSRGKKIIVNFSEKNILDELPYALPPVLAAVKVPEQLCANPSVAESLGRLKEDGYMIALEGFTGSPHCESVYRLADIISVNVAGRPREELVSIIASIGEYSAERLASDVESPDRSALCQEAGFTLFHGPFFKTPQNLKVRKLSSNEVSRFNLLKVIEQEEPDFSKLAELIQADVSISFRLLTYLNSASLGLRHKISSIQQAIPLLGWQKMKSWLRVVLLTDMSRTSHASELFLLSTQRGKFLELVAQDHDYWGFDPDSLSLLGIFSLLDVMLGIPMSDVVAYMPLDGKLKAALCREANNEYLPLLELAMCFEEARWQDAENMMQRLGLNGPKVKAAFQRAIDWAGAISTVGARENGGT